VTVVEVFCHPLPVGTAAANTTDVISAVVDADNCSSSRQALGAECHVTCLPGYHLGQLADNYTCVYDGRAFWYPTTPPVCYGRPLLLCEIVSLLFGPNVALHC